MLSDWQPLSSVDGSGIATDWFRAYPDGRWAAIATPDDFLVREDRAGAGVKRHRASSIEDAKAAADAMLCGRFGHELPP